MATPPYPLSHIPAKKSRLDRNAGWKIPLGCLIVVVFFGGFLATIFTIVETSFRKSEIYHEAINRAEQSSQIANRIGVPLRPGRVLQGQLNVPGSSGTAKMAIPVTGPRGKATIYLDARKTAGTWQFLTLQVHFEGESDCLNLLEGAEATSVTCSQ